MFVCCTGMARSGSTWSFNVCRELLEATGEPLIAGYYGEGEALDDFIHESLPFNVFVCPAWARWANLHRIDPGLLIYVTVDANTITRGATKELVDGHTVALARDIPQCHVDP